LCAAEYRDQAEKCSTCEVKLVASFQAEEFLANPPRLLWRGRDLQEFDLVENALRDAQTPARMERAGEGLIASITRRVSTIHVLANDFERALQASAIGIARSQAAFPETQTCYNCSKECSAFLAVCPNCRTQLIADSAQPKKAELAEATPSKLKYCPVCDSGYLDTYERCTVCGIELVPEEFRGKPLNEKERNEPIDVVWRGGDPAAVSNVVAILREAGIRHNVQASSDHLVFELAMPRPKYLVRVFRSDVPRVQELLAGIQDGPFFGSQVSLDSSETSESVAGSPKQEWSPVATTTATAEIWSGQDAALAKLLEDCFFENRIACRREGVTPGTLRYFVLPADESAAKEIVREIREGTPLA
jgi:hypothetical protein